jgi:hypothetical protein
MNDKCTDPHDVVGTLKHGIAICGHDLTDLEVSEVGRCVYVRDLDGRIHV